MGTVLIGMASPSALRAAPPLSQPPGSPGLGTTEYFVLTAPRDPISVTVNLRPRVGQSRQAAAAVQGTRSACRSRKPAPC